MKTSLLYRIYSLVVRSKRTIQKYWYVWHEPRGKLAVVSTSSCLEWCYYIWFDMNWGPVFVSWNAWNQNPYHTLWRWYSRFVENLPKCQAEEARHPGSPCTTLHLKRWNYYFASIEHEVRQLRVSCNEKAALIGNEEMNYCCMFAKR